eukprot:scaffold90816_cov63-Phaeocystis_antarctica.AAC.3
MRRAGWPRGRRGRARARRIPGSRMRAAPPPPLLPRQRSNAPMGVQPATARHGAGCQRRALPPGQRCTAEGASRAPEPPFRRSGPCRLGCQYAKPNPGPTRGTSNWLVPEFKVNLAAEGVSASSAQGLILSEVRNGAERSGHGGAWRGFDHWKPQARSKAIIRTEHTDTRRRAHTRHDTDNDA